MNIIEFMSDPALCGDQFNGESWNGWRSLLKGFYGLPMTEDEQDLYNALTERTDTPTSASKELWLAIGRRGGKSQIAALIAVYEAFLNDYRDQLSAGEIATAMVIAADRKQARAIFRYVQGIVDGSPMLSTMVLRETTESLELTNRNAIEITTASHRRTRGYTCSLVLADEIAFWYQDGANPDREIINALRPSLATLGGKLIALSSPYARKGVLYDAYRTYYGKEDKRVMVAKAPTQVMNPTLDPEIIEQAYREDEASAKAEYGAEFRSDVESFISREAVEAVTITDRLELPPARANYYLAFVDAAGGSGQDSMTCAVAHRDGKDDSLIIDAVRAIKPPFSPESVVQEFCDLFKLYGVKQVVGDRWGGDFVREQFRKRGINYQPSERTKSEIYAEMLPLINSQRVQLPDIQRLTNELTGLERRNASGGKPKIDHAPNQHDDMINSVAGALVLANERRKLIPAPPFH
ncbi:terminase large subunit [Idiomarina sp. PL1-037]|uniref:terminase large subunit domain-containing protein n=1 Tax=Idiomarina sp. PL1-037 TaxID=3095365 RepID=UPI002ACC274C|nr:terminase large subunit [Idiomarina sp. PL1-037]WQC54199.1 terminase large subunit [Idiomarina sp. PL1-037]